MQEQVANYRFGPFELRSRTQELYKHGTRLKLRGQPFRVLRALLERRGDVLTREDLRDLLWPQETFVDFEHGLNAAISELRGVLSDTASGPRYIETLPKLGYRIKVPVEIAEAESNGSSLSASPANEAEIPAAVETAKGNARRVWRWVVAVATLAAMIGATAGYREWSGRRVAAKQAHGRLMLAVLPRI